MINTIQTAILALREQTYTWQEREPIADELERLIDGAAIVVGLDEREARCLHGSASLVFSCFDGLQLDVIKEGTGDRILAAESAMMKIETAMMSEGMER